MSYLRRSFRKTPIFASLRLQPVGSHQKYLNLLLTWETQNLARFCESTLNCHSERSICEAKNPKFCHCERANASVAIRRICEHCEATIRFVDSAFFSQGGLPRKSYGFARNDEKGTRFCELPCFAS